MARVRDYILSTPDIYNDTSKVITGGGWDHTVWPSWPTAVRSFPPGYFNHSLTISQADLDADSIVRGRPVVLQSKDCHALWVSSKAIEASLPLPEAVEGGVVVRDNAGRPTGNHVISCLGNNSVTYFHSGILLDNAQDLLKQPELTESDLLRRFKVAVRDAHKNGLTSIHDAGLDPTSLAFFNRYIFICCFKSYHLTIFFHKTSPSRHLASECF